MARIIIWDMLQERRYLPGRRQELVRQTLKNAVWIQDKLIV